MAKLQFFTLESIDNYYFDDCQLLGIQSNSSSTQLCFDIERSLGIAFTRKLTNDVAIMFNDAKDAGLGIPGTLFESIPTEVLVHFALYEHKINYSDNSIYLYQNKNDGYYLISEYKQFNYLILIQDNCFLWHQSPLQNWLSKIKSINSCKEIDIINIGKSKENLII